MKGNILFRATFGATGWDIKQEGLDPRNDPRIPSIHVCAEQVLMDVIRRDGEDVLGYLVSCYGVPQESVQFLPASVVTQLGVAGHLKRLGLATPGTHRMRLGSDGRVERA